MATEQVIGALERTYPIFVEENAAHLFQAGAGSWDARNELAEAFMATPYIDPWHRRTLTDIFHTRNDVGDRQMLANEAIELLDEIKGHMGTGEPFLFDNSHKDNSPSFLAGLTTGHTARINSDRSIDLNFGGIKVSADTPFPNFAVDRKAVIPFELTGQIFPDNPLRRLLYIARTPDFFVFGADGIKQAVDAKADPHKKFIAAVALDLAEIETEPIEVDEHFLVEIRPRFVEACALAAAGINAADRGSEKVRVSANLKGHLIHNNGLRDRTPREMRAALAVAGISPGELEHGMREYLDVLRWNDSSSIADVASAIYGMQAVESLVERILPR